MDKLTQAREALETLIVVTKFELGDNIERAPWKRIVARAESALAALSDGEAVEPVADAAGLENLKARIRSNSEDRIIRQCAHYGGVPSRCLITERNWSETATPTRCALCPAARTVLNGERKG